MNHSRLVRLAKRGGCTVAAITAGCLPTVWNNHDRLIDAYLTEYPGYYHTGDGGYLDEDGYLFITGRTDDVINVAGHRLSTGEMEAVVALHPAVAECAVIGVQDDDKGQVPLGLLVLKDGAEASLDAIGSELIHWSARILERLPTLRSTCWCNVCQKLDPGKLYERPWF